MLTDADRIDLKIGIFFQFLFRIKTKICSRSIIVASQHTVKASIHMTDLGVLW